MKRGGKCGKCGNRTEQYYPLAGTTFKTTLKIRAELHKKRLCKDCWQSYVSSLHTKKYSKHLTTLRPEYTSAWKRKESQAHKLIFAMLAEQEECSLLKTQENTEAPLVWYYHNKTEHARGE